MKGFIIFHSCSSGYFLSKFDNDPFLETDRIIKFIGHVYPELKDVCSYNKDKKCFESSNTNYYFDIERVNEKLSMLNIWIKEDIVDEICGL